MTRQNSQTLADIAAAIWAGAPLDAEMVKRVRQLLFGEERLVARMLSSETVDREEADLIFDIQRAHDRERCDPSWRHLYAEAIACHVLKDETSPGALDEVEADYLLRQIGSDGGVDENELEAVVSVISAVRHAPKHFQAFVLTAVADAAIADGAIDESDVRLIRRVIHGEGSGGGARIDERERQFLSDLSAQAAGLQCSHLWHALLLEAGLPG